jgi:hypothetical protein
MSRLIPQPDHHNRFTNWKHLDKHDLYARAGRMSVNPGARRPKFEVTGMLIPARRSLR